MKSVRTPYEEKERAIKKLLSGESSVSFEIRHIHKDGTSLMIHWNAQCVMEKHVFYCIGRDVTLRREMETALRDKKKSLDRLINNIPGAVYRCLVDRNWTILYLSEGIFEISGYSPNDFTLNKTLSYSDLIDERDREYVRNVVHKAIDKKEPFEMTYRIRTVEKKEKWCWEKGEGVFNDGGELLYLEGIIVDISRQKRSEALIKDAHERFKAVLDSIDAQIYVADIETYKVLFVNKKMHEDFSGSIMGIPCYKSFYNSNKPCGHCTNKKLFTLKGKPKEDGYLWEHMNPVTKRWYVNCDKAIKWSDDRMVRIQVATDITKFKAVEAELRQAQKIDALGVLAGGIAHDFNNILSSVIGFTELTVELVEKESLIYENLKEVLVAGHRAKELVKQILAFSRKTDQEFHLVNLNEILQESVKLLRSTLPASIEIIYDAVEEPLTVRGDATQIHQVVLNLGTNAAHAMEAYGGILRIKMDRMILDECVVQDQPRLEKGVYIRILVSDTGCGIAKEHINIIFDPYFTTKEKGKGTGLGLAMVHGIIKAHDGMVRVRSQIDKGTTFEIYLPLLDETPKSFPLKIEREMVGGSEHILFVDDEPQIGKMQQQFFESLGYLVTVVTESREALTLFESNPEKFDLIITDMTMPGMTGDRLAHFLKEIRSDIPIMLCTGFNEKINTQNIEDLEIDGFLMKPPDKKKMADMIRSLLNDKGRQMK